MVPSAVHEVLDAKNVWVLNRGDILILNLHLNLPA